MNADIENLQVFNDAIINYTGGDLYTEDDDKLETYRTAP